MSRLSYSEKVARKKNFILVVFVFVVIVLIYNLITNFVFCTYRIQTKNMSPTFASGEIAGASKMFNIENLERGDLVFRRSIYKSNLNIFQKFINKVFTLFSPNIFIPFDENMLSVTHGSVFRIVGLPGDTIYMRDFVVYIKNSTNEKFLTEFELSDITYDISTTKLPERWEADMPFSGSTDNFVLNDGEFFLLTDNRVAAPDSRLCGKCKIEDIEAKIVFVLWPIKGWRKF